MIRRHHTGMGKASVTTLMQAYDHYTVPFFQGPAVGHVIYHQYICSGGRHLDSARYSIYQNIQEFKVYHNQAYTYSMGKIALWRLSRRHICGL